MNILKRFFKKQRSETEILLSTLDSIAFVALHGQELDRWLAKVEYHKLRNNMLNGRIKNAESRMKLIHAKVSQDLEARIQKK